ncbi:CDP-glycerol glycerophosphotransferase family protein [Petrocella sp. FN5]|uniref:CDP-glycerol glycerophosphotransferase family protein n=1 Tax=Petrocella sp. FN5 TaxID=3032002 RepID=UPI0023D9C42E|nr:CDP-glycerol glycerophosphotransferase family protein [Petrocella sp. FN5]MDF1617747.1 CDP-glycerol glycerophosphotransferase family protein [Petrocella sp. FN5]
MTKSIKKWVKKVPFVGQGIGRLFDLCRKTYMFLCNKIIGVDDNRVVFISFNGLSYSDNPRALSEKLHELQPKMEIIWLFVHPEEKKDLIPDYVQCVKKNTFEALKVLATSKVWIDNFCKPLYTYKGKNQIYVQTWHGDRGFKKVLYNSTFLPKNFRIIENKICDVMVSGSDFGKSVHETAFRFEGLTLNNGTPRNDMLAKNDSKKKGYLNEKIRSLLGIGPEVKIFLYAPTLRREASETGGKQESDGIDLMQVLSVLEDKFKEEWCCVVRAHSAVGGIEGIPEDCNKIKNGNLVEDMNDLLFITDFLITDYSSSAGDIALINKPIILFQSDREAYVGRDRSFYFDIDATPFIIVKNNEALIHELKKMEIDKIPDNCKAILDFYNTKETGESSEKIIEYFMDRIEKDRR